MTKHFIFPVDENNCINTFTATEHYFLWNSRILTIQKVFSKELYWILITTIEHKSQLHKNTLKEIIWSEFRLERNLHDTSYCLQQYLYEVFPVQSFEQCNFSKQILFKKSNLVLSWTCNWRGLTILLSIFVFLIYLFIRLNVSVYILMIYKWSKMRAWHAF